MSLPVISEMFAHVCGRAHCWAPGGELMPVCQRCMGLYVGVVVGAMVMLVLRPRFSNALLWLNGLMMLALIPFGYHLVSQGALLRTATGFCFGVGLSCYGLLLPAELLPLKFKTRQIHCLTYVAISTVWLPIILLAASRGSRSSGLVLAYVAAAGLVIASLMLLLNVALLAVACFARHQSQAPAAA